MPALEFSAMAQELDRKKIRIMREKIGLSQSQAAKRAGFNGGAAQWSDIENGWRANVTVYTLSQIAKALGCDARDLITALRRRK